MHISSRCVLISDVFLGFNQIWYCIQWYCFTLTPHYVKTYEYLNIQLEFIILILCIAKIMFTKKKYTAFFYGLNTKAKLLMLFFCWIDDKCSFRGTNPYCLNVLVLIHYVWSIQSYTIPYRDIEQIWWALVNFDLINLKGLFSRYKIKKCCTWYI